MNAWTRVRDAWRAAGRRSDESRAEARQPDGHRLSAETCHRCPQGHPWELRPGATFHTHPEENR